MPNIDEKKKVQPLIQGRLREADFARNRWFVSCLPGTKVEDLLKPEYWRNVGTQFHQYDRVEAISEDGTWYAEFFVVACDRLWAKMHQIYFADLAPLKADLPKTDNENYDVTWKGPEKKFVVIRKSDNAALKDGFNTQLEGWQWLDGHIRSLAA